MRKAWTDEAWEDYLYWQTQDKKILKRINNILKDIDRQPFCGIGKPEPLKGDWQGYWSRRIDEGNRIIYKAENGQIVIVQCCGHYGE
ncbi:MAG: Txe/YoeB family addiction module toxin [Synergistaceae bacterium]|jgi:toxin YoeB|nr:Txe/YoeB family addiction module toxin [Synergistaceae bacterium]